MTLSISASANSASNFAENLQQGFNSSRVNNRVQNPYRQALEFLDKFFERREQSDIDAFCVCISRLAFGHLNAVDQKISDLFLEKKIIHRICKRECDDWADQKKVLGHCATGSSLDIIGFKARKLLSGNSRVGQIIAIYTFIDFCASGFFAVQAGMQIVNKIKRLKSSTYIVKSLCDISNFLHELIAQHENRLRENARRTQFARLSQAIESATAATLTDHQRAFFGPRAGPIRIPRLSESSADEGSDVEKVGAGGDSLQLREELRDALHQKILADSKVLMCELQNERFRAQIQVLQEENALLKGSRQTQEKNDTTGTSV